MEENNYFPLGTAIDKAFCNRQEERLRLLANINAGRHTLIISPRRYGKTSLALQVAADSKKAFGKVDFLTVSDEYSANKIILDAVGQAVASMSSLQQKTLTRISKWLAVFNPKIILNEEGFKIELTPTLKPQQSIIEALEILDKIAAKEGKKAILLFDEFQQLATLKSSQVLEASIRNVGQSSKHSAYIFSGSNRHMLAMMFDDSTRPLYHLCDRISLNRIESKEYKKFIQNAATIKWKSTLEAEIIEEILFLTNNHPYYVNVLCSRLWTQAKKPLKEQIRLVWSKYVEEEHYRLATEISALSPNQRAILMGLAIMPTSEPTSQQFLQRVRLSAASANQAVHVLLERDFLFRDSENLLRILDAAMEAFLQQGH
ncbi:ATP-binding protein [soil metagenome]